jgi:hypothetical protein
MKPSRGQVHRVCEEFRRQSPCDQLHRFIGTLPPFAVPQDLPKNFLELLHEPERAANARISLRLNRMILDGKHRRWMPAKARANHLVRFRRLCDRSRR